MIPRALEPVLHRVARSYRIVTLTGPRQSGKTKLAREAFPMYAYARALCSELCFRFVICWNDVLWHCRYASNLRERFTTLPPAGMHGRETSKTCPKGSDCDAGIHAVYPTSCRRLGTILGFTSPRSARPPSNELLRVENKTLTTRAL